MRAGQALWPHLGGVQTFVEPCAGAGDLIWQMEHLGLRCVGAYDIEPRGVGIVQSDALKLSATELGIADAIITNPPWTRLRPTGDPLHGMIKHFMQFAPTWLLFDSDWMFTLQSQSLMPFCTDVVPIGKLRWMPGTTLDSTDNCAWYCFDASGDKPTVFHGRERLQFGWVPLGREQLS